jgi:hypothetical protein
VASPPADKRRPPGRNRAAVRYEVWPRQKDWISGAPARGVDGKKLTCRKQQEGRAADQTGLRGLIEQDARARRLNNLMRGDTESAKSGL